MMQIKKITRQEVTSFWFKYRSLFFLALPFLVIDVCMRLLGHKINYFRTVMVVPNLLFVLMWIFLFVGVALNLKSRVGKLWYCLIFAVYFLLFLTNGIYYGLTGFFFSFNLLLMADEGSAYILDAIINAKPYVYIMCIVILAAFVPALKMFPKREKKNGKNILKICAVFLFLHLIAPFCLGFANQGLEWDTWRNPHNVYNNFNDANKCMKICGIYEYAVRDFYMTFLKPQEKDDPDDLAFLEDTYQNLSVSEDNPYTGIFEGKNIIFLQLEGIDSWLLTEEDMPNLYGMMDNAIVFENHYSYYNGGGSTFNSELAVNTGLITPITYVQNAYSFNKNLFDQSLARLFQAKGYRVNAFHMNTGEYYSRRQNYLNWGYDHYYSLLDENNYDDLSYELDRELILDDEFYERLFQEDGPFLHYIITYTNHTPFTTKKGMGKLLAEKVYAGSEIPDLDEEECARMYAAETDLMVSLLLEGLKDNGLYDNTVIVAYADHYLYTLEDKTILDKYKETDNTLINHTPFFIWSSDLERQDVEKVNGQIDILPTVLNLFGIEYIPEYYIGNDVMDEDYAGYVFFSDGSWYDGKTYSAGEQTEGGEGLNQEQQVDSYVEEMNQKIDLLIKKNDLTLKYDYFRTLWEKEN